MPDSSSGPRTQNSVSASTRPCASQPASGKPCVFTMTAVVLPVHNLTAGTEEASMAIRILVLLTVINVMLLSSSTAIADTVKLKDGTKLEGIIRKIEAGTVHMQTGNTEQVFD